MHEHLIVVLCAVYSWWPGEVCLDRYVPTNIQQLNHVDGEFPVYFFGSRDYLWASRGRYVILLVLYLWASRGWVKSRSTSISSGHFAGGRFVPHERFGQKQSLFLLNPSCLVFMAKLSDLHGLGSYSRGYIIYLMRPLWVRYR